MIDNFIDDYKKHRKKIHRKGYKVVGIPSIIIFILTFGFMVLGFFLLPLISNWFIFLEIASVIILFKIDKRVDNLINLNWLKDKAKLKGYISCYLKENGFTLSSQFKELSIILKQRSEKKYKKYDLTSYISIIVAIVIFVLGILVNDNLKLLFVVVALSCIFIIINISLIIIFILVYLLTGKVR
ncbi:hypothetical protein [Rummeliibacillus stabekisii]|uniref:hypothetical protein n=1 Tax=Rummeliibacillus stabekisii TaxID=241244 RepID=UPI00116DFC4C|nr:hypothetical protein [Rummeliibacillus stabekisii]MBB5170990.1 hypothetical protein [Rummeliibacillus stabekisii]GEL05356.1 hypothetical protein RST01_19830 [Rummeliibacillus stabekisii]